MPTSRLIPERRGGISRRLVAAGRADRDAQLVPGERNRRAAARRDRAEARPGRRPPSPRSRADPGHLGLRDTALLPVQLDGLDELVDDLSIVTVPEAGHFVPWEAPVPVAKALEGFLPLRRVADWKNIK